MLNKDKLLQTLELVDSCVKSANDEGSVQTLLDKLDRLIPFKSAVIAIDFQHQFQLRSAQQLFSYNLDKAWQEIYFQRQFYTQDPVLQALGQANQLVDWQSAFANRQLSKNFSRDFQQLSLKYVGHQGISIVVNNHFGSTLLSLATHQPTDKETNQLFGYIAPHFHELFTREGSNQRNKLELPKLSARELETLQWTKEGKSNGDIAIILGISERTVKFHLANIFVKLNVVNRAQAIAKAMQFGIV
ncbi:LuxR C-terminal-related transcriptional regulator [Pseudoalteromonas fenneropenaei]|uniref:LuxR C-terminal-related transcriptional regulator n=1 Tax=Pseudoalteromonas fenneropenaei TaxID=1737459 RepID=A0ABV7CP81_9GAMM